MYVILYNSHYHDFFIFHEVYEHIFDYYNNLHIYDCIDSNVAGHDVTFIHPKSAVGVLVELVQYPNRGKVIDIDSTDGMS